MTTTLSRDPRGFRRLVARANSQENVQHDALLRPTHTTTRPITLWHGPTSGPTSPVTLPAGTAIEVRSEARGLIRFRYAGLPEHEHAIAASDAAKPSDQASTVPDIE